MFSGSGMGRLHAHVIPRIHPDTDGVFRFVSGQCLRMTF